MSHGISYLIVTSCLVAGYSLIQVVIGRLHQRRQNTESACPPHIDSSLLYVRSRPFICDGVGAETDISQRRIGLSNKRCYPHRRWEQSIRFDGRTNAFTVPRTSRIFSDTNSPRGLIRPLPIARLGTEAS